MDRLSYLNDFQGSIPNWGLLIWNVVSGHRRGDLCSCCQRRVSDTGSGARRYSNMDVPPLRLVLFQYGMTDMDGGHHILDIASTDDAIGVYLFS